MPTPLEHLQLKQQMSLRASYNRVRESSSYDRKCLRLQSEVNTSQHAEVQHLRANGSYLKQVGWKQEPKA